MITFVPEKDLSRMCSVRADILKQAIKENFKKSLLGKTRTYSSTIGSDKSESTTSRTLFASASSPFKIREFENGKRRTEYPYVKEKIEDHQSLYPMAMTLLLAAESKEFVKYAKTVEWVIHSIVTILPGDRKFRKYSFTPKSVYVPKKRKMEGNIEHPTKFCYIKRGYHDTTSTTYIVNSLRSIVQYCLSDKCKNKACDIGKINSTYEQMNALFPPF
jgi:hypothetical protein